MTIEAKARSFIQELSGGVWTHPRSPFDETLSAALPPAKLRDTWKSLESSAGAFRSIAGGEVQSRDPIRVVSLTCKFERAALVAKVSYDAHDRIAGLYFVPPLEAWTPPPYVRPGAFEEREVVVGTSPSLPGTLSIPKGTGRHPAIVLVHGSGPMDADETVGGVKTFKDLAWGLASHGVAVLRYTKRSRHSPMGIVTQKEEVLDGARDALEVLRHVPEMDSNRLFILGHSQGGYLAPRIAQQNPGLSGIIILAGSTRPLEDSILEQLTYLASTDPNNVQLASALDRAKRFKQTVEDPNLDMDQNVELPTGGHVQGAYFLDVRGYDPPAVARSLSCRILVLQGERDYQVTKNDFEGWKAALAGKPTVSFKSYPSLNHLFVRGEGASTPAEYQRAGHVDEEVVKDVSNWVLHFESAAL
ncbi:alpha/beta fold hydrolase [Pendulispora brunnea]|uniref:Alpha/beta fold hydrolase n=1 Tax=Pendulispora brunnea TaxID=2905690 RepID=A0ABZ2KNT8_9BACT